MERGRTGRRGRRREREGEKGRSEGKGEGEKERKEVRGEGEKERMEGGLGRYRRRVPSDIPHISLYLWLLLDNNGLSVLNCCHT